MPTEKEFEAEARKQCLRAFEPYTYGPYFDALRDEYRRKAREILEHFPIDFTHSLRA